MNVTVLKMHHFIYYAKLNAGSACTPQHDERKEHIRRRRNFPSSTAHEIASPEMTTCRDLIIGKIIVLCHRFIEARRAASFQSLKEKLYFIFV